MSDPSNAERLGGLSSWWVPREPRPKRILIDDVTYLVLQDSYLPLHWLGVLAVWNGHIADPVEYLVSRGSDGVIIGCVYLPQRMRRAAAVSGQVCAISRDGLRRLAET